MPKIVEEENASLNLPILLLEPDFNMGVLGVARRQSDGFVMGHVFA
jgi:hypothetical protein